MKEIFHQGDIRAFSKKVLREDCAAFNGQMVHPLYSTFALARDAEWCCRLFVLDMKEDDEEGIGTFIQIEHLAPAPVHAAVDFTAVIEEIKGNEIICSFQVQKDKIIIARGKQKQKVLKKERLERLYH